MVLQPPLFTTETERVSKPGRPRPTQGLATPALLTWARTSAGYSLEDAAGRLGVLPGRLAAWETGQRRPTLRQLRMLARVCRRPLAVFFLHEPPQDFQPLHDFRHLPDRGQRPLSPQLLFQIRLAHHRRETALALYRDLYGEPAALAQPYLPEDPELAGEVVRDLLGVTIHGQAGQRTTHDALRYWRSAVERLGALVFQVSHVSILEMRGFAIDELPFPVIATNARDSPLARVFTIVHELVHVLRRSAALCDTYDYPQLASGEEPYCNAVTGAALVPRLDLVEQPLVSEKVETRGGAWSEADIGKLSRRYWVSHEVVLRRLLALGRISYGFYQQKREEYQQRFSHVASRPSRGHATVAQTVVATTGRPLLRLALDSYYFDKITAGELSDILGTRLKHLPAIERGVVSGPMP